MTDSHRLLADYAMNGSEAAFRELVSRYLNLVYSASVRLVDGDTHLAEDVAQTVFVDLARKAGSLSSEVMLGGWLHRHTCFVAAKIMRGERRRRFRERQATLMNALNDHTEANLAQIRPFLDEAINQLGAEERTAILLRFFEQNDFRAIGRALGSSDDTAQKRVTRALEKLHTLLKRRGVACSASLLATALAGEAVTAAPVGLGLTIAGTVLAGAAAGTGTTLTFLKFMALTKFKAGIIAAVLTAGVAIPLVIQQRANARLQTEDESLRLQQQQLARLQAQNQQLAAAVGNAALSSEQSKDLEKLRGEIGALRQQTNAVAALRQENRRLRTSLAKPKSPIQTKEDAMVRMNSTKDWLIGFYQYAEKNQGQFPTNFDLAIPFVSQETRNSGNSITDQFEIVFQGSPSTLEKPQDTIVLREKEAWETAPTADRKGKWAKMYGFADGHIEIHQERENDFEAYEKQHLFPPPTAAQ
jgi:RNA polymerase sigma factor (sigma-70 family)